MVSGPQVTLYLLAEKMAWQILSMQPGFLNHPWMIGLFTIKHSDPSFYSKIQCTTILLTSFNISISHASISHFSFYISYVYYHVLKFCLLGYLIIHLVGMAYQFIP